MEDPTGERKPYQVPVLLEMGDIRTLTMGASLGIGDSGQSTGTFIGPTLEPPIGF